MAEGVLMPKSGITVEECVISEWKVKPGDVVKKGDILFTYETDKSEFECESTAEGTVLELFYQDGDEVPVLVNVCAVGTPGDDVSALRPGGAASAPVQDAPAAAAPAAAPTAAVSTAVTAASANPNAHVSPRARAAAANLGVDPALAAATGPHGRVIERDVRAYAASRPGTGIGGMPLSTDTPDAGRAAVPAEKSLLSPAASGEAAYEDVKFSGVRRATAKAMAASLHTMAQLTHHHSFDASAVLAFRKQLKADGEKLGLPNITLNDMVLFAVSRVLMKHPDLNATIPQENVLRRYRDVHLGMAVDTPKGLFVPTIRCANRLTLSEISVEAKRLAKLCQEGKATPDMLSGASFTVSNLGSVGVEMFTPVVNPPQVAILGVCTTVDRVRERDGVLSVYPAMGLSLTYDHRAVDGAPASRFAKELGEALEHFTLLLV